MDNFAEEISEDLKQSEDEKLTNCDPVQQSGYYIPSPYDIRNNAMHFAISTYSGTSPKLVPTSEDVIERAKAYEAFLNEIIGR